MKRILKLGSGVLTLVLLASFGLSVPADARRAKGKAKPVATAPVQRVATGVKGDGWEAFPGFPGHRDRSTIYHPNGRLNGQELFDSIADRSADGGS